MDWLTHHSQYCFFHVEKLSSILFKSVTIFSFCYPNSMLRAEKGIRNKSWNGLETHTRLSISAFNLIKMSTLILLILEIYSAI